MRNDGTPRYGAQVLVSLLVALLLVLGAGGVAAAALNSNPACGGYGSAQDTGDG